MVIVAGWIRVAPEEREAYLAGCRTVIAQARAARGCLDFVLAADPVEPGRIHVYERWESDADVERFRGDGPEPAQAAAIHDAEVKRYRIASVEDA